MRIISNESRWFPSGNVKSSSDVFDTDWCSGLECWLGIFFPFVVLVLFTGLLFNLVFLWYFRTILSFHTKIQQCYLLFTKILNFINLLYWNYNLRCELIVLFNGVYFRFTYKVLPPNCNDTFENFIWMHVIHTHTEWVASNRGFPDSVAAIDEFNCQFGMNLTAALWKKELILEKLQPIVQ